MRSFILPLLGITIFSASLTMGVRQLMHETSPDDITFSISTMEHPKGTITIELARTAQQHRVGLMHREALPDDHGMLFIYPEPDIRCFWMKNTQIPLTVAFLDNEGSILQTADMTPHSRTPHCSEVAVQYGLEMNQGWFSDHDIQKGDTLMLPPEIIKK